MENDILFEGIIQYTKKKKLKWKSFSKNDSILIYRSVLRISNIKEIQIEFLMNKENEFKSSISIDILTEINKLRPYKFITLFDLKSNRFKELLDIINQNN